MSEYVCKWCYDHGLRYPDNGKPWAHGIGCPNNRSAKILPQMDMARLIRALPSDVNKKLSLHDLRRVCDNYNSGFKAGDMVRLSADSNFSYEVAVIKHFPHGLMVGIYDEPPSKHVDFWNPSSLIPAAQPERRMNDE